jgi:sulfur carrier protein
MTTERPTRGAIEEPVRHRVVVNGVDRELPETGTLHALAAELGVADEVRGVAIAVDGIVIPRGQWMDVVLRDDAKVEVVRASAGG